MIDEESSNRIRSAHVKVKLASRKKKITSLSVS